MAGELDKTPAAAGGGEAPVKETASGGSGLPERLQILLAILLGLTALLTAWAAYRGDLYGGDSLIRFNEAVQKRDEASASFNVARQNESEDVQLFTEWQIALQNGDQELADFVRNDLFRNELIAAVEWWESEEAGDAPTPFVDENPEYVLEATTEGEKLDREADRLFKEGRELDDTGDSYIFWTVVLAAALFMFGVAAVTSARKVFWGAAGVGVVMVVVAVIGLISVTSGAPPLVD